MAYTTKAKVESLFGINIPASAVDGLNTLIASAKLFIDKYCGKTFESVSETRYYDGNGFDEILIDAFTALTSVEILNEDGTTYRSLSTSDYQVLPWNGTEKGSIRLKRLGSQSVWPKCERYIKVVATFGASTSAPEDIQLAATKMVGQAYNDLGGEGNLTSVKLGDYAATYAALNEKQDALGIFSILDQHRDIEI